MKTKTIEVKFPTIEGMKVENASVDLKNGVSVVEYVEEVKFKKGDVLYCEYFRNGGYHWICINENINNIGNGRYFSCLIIKGTDSTNVFKLKNASFQNVELDIIRLATDSEKQLLFDALEKDGKYWDAENLEVKELGLSDRIDRIAFDSKNMSVAEISKKIKDIIDKEVNKAVNEIYK